MTPLTDLLVRVEKATGPDRELDTAIGIALRVGADNYPRFPLGSFHNGYVQANMGRDGWSVGWIIPRLTSSLDAALALCERMLPKLCIMLASASPSGWWARLREVPEPQISWQANAPTPALALLAAMLKALIALPTSPTEP